ncbi:MAG: hypothetical protein QM673_12265 [Gordonia sp. (in: high G+C Gram-positive bacteria)]
MLSRLTPSTSDSGVARDRFTTAVVWAPIVAIAVQLVIRVWLVATGNFYWDDLILIGRASTHPIMSWDYLGHSHDGHFMPAAFLVAGVSTLIAPLDWLIPALTLVALWMLAAFAVWRMIRVVISVLGSARSVRFRAVSVLAALTVYLFSPMTVPAFVWWSAGLNSLPMQAALAWVVGDAVALCAGRIGPGSPRVVVVRSTLVVLLALAFFEKSLVIAPVAVMAVLLVTFGAESAGAGGSRRRAAIAALMRGRALWTALTVVSGCWLVVYLAVSDPLAGTHSVGQTVELVGRSINGAVVPSLVGGPWAWERWIPGPPMATPQPAMIVAGWGVVGVVVVWAATRRRGCVAVLICTALYVVGVQIPVMWNRSAVTTAPELAQTMRYLPDSALVLALGIAMVLVSPPRHVTAGPPPRLLIGAGMGAGVALFASTMVSVTGYAESWQNDPTGAYLATAKRSLAANSSATIFDQSLPLEILLPVAYPENRISHTFGRIGHGPRFGAVTDRLIVLDNSGRAVPGMVTPLRRFQAGPGSCSRPEAGGPRRVRLDGPVVDWRWTIALSYCANSTGRIAVSLCGGNPVSVPVARGLHVVYVQLDGHGEDIRIRPLTPGVAIHTGAGWLGQVVDARLLGG